MGQIQRLEWNDRAQNALFIGVICGITALTCRQLSHSSWRLQPETRDVFRDISIVSGTFSLAGFLFAYGLALPEKAAPAKSKLKQPTPDPSPPSSRKGTWAQQLEKKVKPAVGPLSFTGDFEYPFNYTNLTQGATCEFSEEDLSSYPTENCTLSCKGIKRYYLLDQLLEWYKTKIKNRRARNPLSDSRPTAKDLWVTPANHPLSPNQKNAIIQLLENDGFSVTEEERADS